MYAVLQNNKVIIGPKEWNRSFFSFRLQRLGFKNPIIPKNAPKELPYYVNESIKIVHAKLIYDEINYMVQYHRGPIWSIENDIAIAHYQAIDTPIEQAKGNFKIQAADERYKKEVSGTTVVIQDKEISIDTSREGRNIFIQKFSIMSDEETVNWKFPQGWLNLSKADLGLVVQTGANYIQSAFDWEKNINDQIEAAETAEELLAIKIVEEIEEDLNGAI